MRAFISIALLVVAFGCSSARSPQAAVPPSQLYFALELYEDGQMVAKPKLLGENGKRLRAERRQPGAKQPDYRLSLTPVLRGDKYSVELDVALKKGQGRSSLSLLHGEQRRLELGRFPGELAVSLTLMEVDSPEFRALMALSEQPLQPGIGGAGAM
jgi:hypothetical protein